LSFHCSPLVGLLAHGTLDTHTQLAGQFLPFAIPLRQRSNLILTLDPPFTGLLLLLDLSLEKLVCCSRDYEGYKTSR
jgi:hypothetical protein